MTALLLALALAAQPGPMFGNGPPPSAPPPPHELPDGREATRTGSPRQVLHAFGACIAERNSLVADSIIRMDADVRAVGRRLNEVLRRDRDCFRQRGGRMGFQHLGIIGAMAERLLERDRTPLNFRLARAASGAGPAPRDSADRAAMCVARSVPDQISALLATGIDSSAEAEAVQALMPALNACSQGGARMSVSTAGVRALLAKAAYRRLNSPAATGSEGQSG